MTTIPYSRQAISEADIAAVVEVLRSDFLTQGPVVPAFESAVAARVGAPHAVAVNSATSGLHLACLALGVGPGSRVWTSPNSFVASANCALYCGASVDFVDIDPRTLNLSADALAEKIAREHAAGRPGPDVVIPVHFAGQSCDMDALGTLARAHGFRIIEDASHALGARWKDAPVGACRHSDIAVFSFHPVKIITTGEGGLVTTRDPALAQRLVDLRSHGISRDATRLNRPGEGAWYYEQQVLGYNYRMTELQAALGLSQLGALDGFERARNERVARYDAALAGLPLVLPWRHPAALSSHHLYVVQLADGAPMGRRALFDHLRRSGVMVNVHYIPIHTQPHYAAMGFSAGDFPFSESYYERALSLPLYPELAKGDQERVIALLRQGLGC
jgi:UDP-4-amino-4,6-dideoxy-N-acetyl-beta-L-altrosamine transaminase